MINSYSSVNPLSNMIQPISDSQELTTNSVTVTRHQPAQQSSDTNSQTIPSSSISKVKVNVNSTSSSQPTNPEEYSKNKKQQQQLKTFELTVKPELLELQSSMPFKDYSDYSHFSRHAKTAFPTLKNIVKSMSLIYSKIPYNTTVECFTDGINVSKRKFYHSIAVDGRSKNFFKSTSDEIKDEYCFANPPWTESYIEQTFKHFEQLKCNTTVTYVLPNWKMCYYAPPDDLKPFITVSKIYVNTSPFYCLDNTSIMTQHIMFTVYYHFDCVIDQLTWTPYTVSRPKKSIIKATKNVSRDPAQIDYKEIDDNSDDITTPAASDLHSLLTKSESPEQSTAYISNIKYPVNVFLNDECPNNTDHPCQHTIKSNDTKVILLNLPQEQLSHVVISDDGSCSIIPYVVESVSVTLNVFCEFNGEKIRKQITVNIDEMNDQNAVSKMSSTRNSYDEYHLYLKDVDRYASLSSLNSIQTPVPHSVTVYPKFVTTPRTTPQSHYYDLPTSYDTYNSILHSDSEFNKNLNTKYHLDPVLTMNSIMYDISKSVSFSPYQAIVKQSNTISPYLHNFYLSKMTDLEYHTLPSILRPLDQNGAYINVSSLTAEPIPKQCLCNLTDVDNHTKSLFHNPELYELKEFEAKNTPSKNNLSYGVDTFLPAVFSISNSKFKTSSRTPTKVLSIKNSIGRSVDVMYYLRALQLDDHFRAFFYHSIHQSTQCSTLPSLRPLLSDNVFIGSVFLFKTFVKDSILSNHDMCVQISLYIRDKYLIVEVPVLNPINPQQIAKQTRTFTFTSEFNFDFISKDNSFATWLLSYCKTIVDWNVTPLSPMFHLDMTGFKANVTNQNGSNIFDLPLLGMLDKDKEEFRGYIAKCASYSSKFLNSQFKIYDGSYSLIPAPYQLRGRHDRVFEDTNSYNRFNTSNNYGQWSNNFIPNYVNKVYSNFMDRTITSNSYSQRNTFNTFVSHEADSSQKHVFHMCEFCNQVYPSMFGAILCKASHLATSRFKLPSNPLITYDLHLLRGINPNDDHHQVTVPDIINFLTKLDTSDLKPIKLFPTVKDLHASKNYVLFSVTIIDNTDQSSPNSQIYYTKIRNRPIIAKNRNYNTLFKNHPVFSPQTRPSRSSTVQTSSRRTRSTSRFNPSSKDTSIRSSSVSRVYYNSNMQH